ncbi:DMT family transporter [Neobacillus massiliamazoniensis]|jgi:paired small multidrug resistance pump|nr:SMR family transporter [Neobacillus massiliamazoniensis]
MGWVFVFFAAVNELIGVWGLNLFSKKRTVKNGLIYLGGLSASFAFIYTSFQYLDTSVAYAVWTGIGTAGAVLLNMIFYGEGRSWSRLASLGAIIIGVTGLKLLS